MEKTKFYLNKELLPDKDAQAQLRVAKTREKITGAIKTFAKEVGEKSIEFSPEMLLYITEVKRWYEERLKDIGVSSNIVWGEHIFKIPTLFTAKGHNKTALASSGLGIIQVGDLSKEELIPVSDDEIGKTKTFLPIRIDDDHILSGMSKEEAAKELRNYVEALHIAHELYHDTVPTHIFVRSIQDESMGEKIHHENKIFDRAGLHYKRHTQTGKFPSLEEGLAMIAQEKAAEVAHKQFPKGYMLYFNLLDYARTKDLRLHDNVPDYYLSVENFDGESVKYQTIQYIDSYNLVYYLLREVPDFKKLAEQARIDGKTLQLARALNERFGKGSYKRIVTCTDDKAYALLNQLRTQV